MTDDPFELIVRSWHIEPDGENFVKKGMSGKVIATVYGDILDIVGDAKSNAQLLSSSPKLLEALEGTLPHFKYEATMKEAGEGKEAAFLEICQVENIEFEIAKAKGGKYEYSDFIKKRLGIHAIDGKNDARSRDA